MIAALIITAGAVTAVCVAVFVVAMIKDRGRS